MIYSFSKSNGGGGGEATTAKALKSVSELPSSGSNGEVVALYNSTSSAGSFFAVRSDFSAHEGVANSAPLKDAEGKDMCFLEWWGDSCWGGEWSEDTKMTSEWSTYTQGGTTVRGKNDGTNVTIELISGSWSLNSNWNGYCTFSEGGETVTYGIYQYKNGSWNKVETPYFNMEKINALEQSKRVAYYNQMKAIMQGDGNMIIVGGLNDGDDIVYANKWQLEPLGDDKYRVFAEVTGTCYSSLNHSQVRTYRLYEDGTMVIENFDRYYESGFAAQAVAYFYINSDGSYESGDEYNFYRALTDDSMQYYAINPLPIIYRETQQGWEDPVMKSRGVITKVVRTPVYDEESGDLTDKVTFTGEIAINDVLYEGVWTATSNSIDMVSFTAKA